MAYGFLRIFGVGRSSRASHALSSEELRTVVAEAGPMIPARHRQMLLSILDLGQITVNDIMIPRQEISAIDVQENWDDILDQLRQTPHTRLPVYDGELDNLVGILHMKRVAQELARGTLTRDRLVEIARNREPYFVPEETSLNVQLSQFQRNRRRLAFVVNEYGDIEGLVTLEDILEEIVGEFTTDPATVTHKDIHVERPGVYIVNASATIRALNRALQWQLPTDGPKTLNGLLLEQLEMIPDPGTALKVGPYQFEILQIAENAIKTVRVQDGATQRPSTARRLVSELLERRFQRLANTAHRHDLQTLQAACGGVVLRNDRQFEPLLLRLLQTLLAVRHRPHLAREADLAERDEGVGHRAVGQARRQGDHHRQIPRRLADLDAADDVDEHVVLLQRDAGMAIEHGQQHGDPVGVDALARCAAALRTASGPPAPAARSATAARPRG